MDKKVLLVTGGAVAVLLGLSVSTGRLHLGGHKLETAHAVSSLPPPLSDKNSVVQTLASPPPDSNAAAANAMLASLATTDSEAGNASHEPAANERPSDSASLARPGELATRPESAAPSGPDARGATTSESSPPAGVNASLAVNASERDNVARYAVVTGPSTTAPSVDSHPPDSDKRVASSASVSSAVSTAAPAPVVPSPSVAATASGPRTPDVAVVGAPGALRTGEDLMVLQGELSVIQKRQAIASAEEAIANATLNAAKAKWELMQIGRPKVEEKDAAADRAAHLMTMAATPPHSLLESLELVGTTAVGPTIVATVRLNGRLTDVRAGSLLAGCLVEKVTAQSLLVLDQGRLRTVYLN